MKLTLIVTTLLFLSACATQPSLHYDNHEKVSIVMNDKILFEGKGNLVYTHRINLQSLSIKQSVLQMSDATLLSYEDAKVQSGYQFTHGMNRLIHLLFNNYQSKLVATKGNIFLYELADLNQKERIYLILENMNKKRVKLLYGLDKERFDVLSKILLKTSTSTLHVVQIKQKTQKKPINASMQIKTQWSYKNIILDGMIRKVGGKARRK